MQQRIKELEHQLDSERVVIRNLEQDKRALRQGAVLGLASIHIHSTVS